MLVSLHSVSPQTKQTLVRALNYFYFTVWFNYQPRDLSGWFNYWQNVSEAWKRRNHPSVHIMFYERTKKHPQREVRKLAQFLELDRTDEQLDKVMNETNTYQSIVEG